MYESTFVFFWRSFKMKSGWYWTVDSSSESKNPVLIDNEVVEYETVVELYNSKIEEKMSKIKNNELKSSLKNFLKAFDDRKK